MSVSRERNSLRQAGSAVPRGTRRCRCAAVLQGWGVRKAFGVENTPPPALQASGEKGSFSLVGTTQQENIVDFDRVSVSIDLGRGRLAARSRGGQEGAGARPSCKTKEI